jgi:hypothetical protein
VNQSATFSSAERLIRFRRRFTKLTGPQAGDVPRARWHTGWVPRAEPSSTNAADRSVLPWRIIAGGFLHFALPAYLLVGLACCAAGLLGGLTVPEVTARVLPYSVRFFVIYAALAPIAAATAAVLDLPLRQWRQRRAGLDPHAKEYQSRRNLAVALAEGRSRLDRDAVALLDAVASVAWHHEEPSFQSVSADLAQVVRTSAAALRTVTPRRRQELAVITAATLTRIVDGLRDLQEERARFDEGDLRTVARYVDSRYPPLD